MAIIEICNSAFEHTPIDSLDKKYYKHRLKDKIICDECLNVYLDEAAKTLTWEIYNCIKSIDMQSMIKDSTFNRNDSFSFTYERDMITNHMQYILPTKFELNISIIYDKIERYQNTNYDSLTSISTTNSNMISVVKIARAKISPVVCDSTYVSFDLYLDIRENDTEEFISNRIRKYLTSFVVSFFKELPNIAVQNMMNKKNNGIWQSHSSDCTAKVSNNQIYCLNCMYEIVVQLAIDNNITDLVGLSVMNNNTSNYAVVNSLEWKRSVIDKYTNAVMNVFGVKPNIVHYTMTCF